MVIRFECPEGHPLTAAEDLIGKAGKCPKCGSKFLVPDPNAEEEVADIEEVVEEAPEPEPPASGDQIVFLCPNGHKLNGPRRLQGQPGQCPHCGARFRIPSYDDEEEAEEPAIEEPAAMPTGDMLDPAELAGSGIDEVEELPEEVLEVVDDEEEEFEAPPLPPPAAGENSLGAIFTNLWRQRQADTQVEVYLDRGEVLEPLQYSPALSQRQYAVFVLPDKGETHRVVTVPWEAVIRIDFGGVQHLPRGWFE